VKAVVQTRYGRPEDVPAIGGLPEPTPWTGQVLLRLTDLDHLRAALVSLVIVHHVALVYGAIAPFYYVEPPFDDPLAYTLLGVFALTNQAWFMGTLFLLAGYFTPRSFDRRGASAFVRARLVRLGIPILPSGTVGEWAQHRLLDTVLGCGLALASMYLLWPRDTPDAPDDAAVS